MSAEEASRIARAVQRMKHSKRAVQIALPTAAALGAGAAIAAGAIPGSDGTITGCYNSKTENGVPQDIFIDDQPEAPGALRVIDPSLSHTVTPPGAGAIPNLDAVCEPGRPRSHGTRKVLLVRRGPPDQPAARVPPAVKAPPARR